MNSNLLPASRKQLPADVVLLNAKVVNVFNGEIEPGNIAITAGRVAGVGDYTEGARVIDLGGRYVAPGFIDGHTHLESSMLDVVQYARAVVPRGTLAVVTDLHEIANVAGLDGMRYMLDSARRLPLDVFLMAPSCVPATNLETPGATLDVEALRKVIRWRDCIGLGEMMNFPGVLNGDVEVMGKLDLFQGMVIDGHAPGLRGADLNAYIAAGILSDHESVTLDEAREKLERGMFIMIREGSSEKNLEALLPLVTDKTYGRCMFVVDDRSCKDLLNDGDIDAVVRKAISLGMDPVRAIQLVTINPARYFKLAGLGAIAPGYWANLVIFSDIARPEAEAVFCQGQPVARNGEPRFALAPARNTLGNTVKIKPFGIEALRLPASGDTALVIEVIPGQIVTRKKTENIKASDGAVVPDVTRDIAKLVVVERHHATGNVGVGLVTGFGLKQGAIASSVAHDSHNIVAAGTNDEDILAAVREIERLQGGLAVTAGGKVLASLPLPVAGLLSDKPLEVVAAGLEEVEQASAQIGTVLPAPFATLSFVALPVIPELRLTDLGLVDVNEFRLVK